MASKILVIQLHYPDTPTPLNTLLLKDVYEKVAPHIVHRTCSINELHKLRDMIVDYALKLPDS